MINISQKKNQIEPTSTSLQSTVTEFQAGNIDKAIYIRTMYEQHHSKLVDYSTYLSKTNIKKIEIEDQKLIMTSRDRGVRIECIPNDHRLPPIEILNFFDYEKEEFSMIEKLVNDGDVIYDIGANIGWHSINLAASRRSSRIFAFEPVPVTFFSLTNNLALNNLTNVTPLNFGLSNNEGSFDLFYYSEGSANASLRNVANREDAMAVSCQLKTLDNFSKENGLPVNFIKCDVEGAELLVLQGACETINKHHPIIFLEILRKWSAKFNYDPNEIFALLRNNGYQAFTVAEQFLVPFGEMTQDTIETNFFFLSENQHADLIRRHLRR
jgi:FkbM family methyltransferase